jgi:hypothetical protein
LTAKEIHMADSICPLLGSGSVDMNALHDAAKRGSDLDVALAAATTRVEPGDPQPEQAAPAPTPTPPAPSDDAQA